MVVVDEPAVVVVVVEELPLPPFFWGPACQGGHEDDYHEHHDHSGPDTEPDPLSSAETLKPAPYTLVLLAWSGIAAVSGRLSAHRSLVHNVLESRITGAKVQETAGELGDPPS